MTANSEQRQAQYRLAQYCIKKETKSNKEQQEMYVKSVEKGFCFYQRTLNGVCGKKMYWNNQIMFATAAGKHNNKEFFL